jgi:UDPglucose 6-dehydrogenase
VSGHTLLPTGLRIAVFGTGYLGATHAACMAELGHDVLGVDVDPSKLQAGEAPFYEPGLEEVLQRNIAAGRLRFTSSYEEAAGWGGRAFPRGRNPAEEGRVRRRYDGGGVGD